MLAWARCWLGNSGSMEIARIRLLNVVYLQVILMFEGGMLIRDIFSNYPSFYFSENVKGFPLLMRKP